MRRKLHVLIQFEVCNRYSRIFRQIRFPGHTGLGRISSAGVLARVAQAYGLGKYPVPEPGVKADREH